MRNWLILLGLVVLAGGCGKADDVTEESTTTTEKGSPAEKQAAFPTDKVITNSIGMKLVRIPAGEFMMGSPVDEVSRNADEKLHPIRITKPFYLGLCEVTVGEFRRFVTDTSYRTDAERDGRGGAGWNETEKKFQRFFPRYSWLNVGFTRDDRHPVTNVSWSDAVAFCDWLSKKERRTYRLPTEAEWEYACRAGTTTRFYHGDDAEDLVRFGNVADTSYKQVYPRADYASTSSDGYVFSSPVCSFLPNEFGLYDMHGNVWEWCSDWYDSNHYYFGETSPHDPSGPTTGSSRVLRGGSWTADWALVRSAYRWSFEPYFRMLDLGFRLALAPAK